MTASLPNVIVIAGCNGSGKSTAAPALVRDYLGMAEFVNADLIAQGLSGFGAESVARQAGRIMLGRLRELADKRADFAFETTLSGHTFARWLSSLRGTGYRVTLLFLWLPSPEMALARVASRVRQGGHHVPDETVRRRYHAGLTNFFHLYRPIVNAWAIFDNSKPEGYERVAAESEGAAIEVANETLWNTIRESYL
jgi:predicted ABC-type ATPase